MRARLALLCRDDGGGTPAGRGGWIERKAERGKGGVVGGDPMKSTH